MLRLNQEKEKIPSLGGGGYAYTKEPFTHIGAPTIMTSLPLRYTSHKDNT